MYTFFLYILLSFYTAFFAWITSISKNNITKILFGMLTIFIPSFFSGIREGVGTDYYNYVAIFNGNLSRTSFESGFKFLVDIIRLITNSEHVFLGSLTFVMMFFILISLLFYKKYINVGLGMFVFMLLFYFQSLNISRQMIAVAILFYSLKYVWENKMIKFLILVLLATSFHYSSLIFSPIYFIITSNYFTKENFLKIFIFYVFVISFFLNLDLIVGIFNNINSFIYIPEGYFIKDNTGGVSLSNGIKNGVYFVIIFYVILKKKIDLNNIYFKYTLILLSCGYIFGIVGNLYNNDVINRIALPFNIVLIFIIPYILKELKSKNEFPISVILISYTFIVFVYDYFYMGFSEIVPFHSIF